jgi:hypothetical protein
MDHCAQSKVANLRTHVRRLVKGHHKDVEAAKIAMHHRRLQRVQVGKTLSVRIEYQNWIKE